MGTVKGNYAQLLHRKGGGVVSIACYSNPKTSKPLEQLDAAWRGRRQPPAPRASSVGDGITSYGRWWTQILQPVKTNLNISYTRTKSLNQLAYRVGVNSLIEIHSLRHDKDNVRSKITWTWTWATGAGVGERQQGNVRVI